MPTPLADEHVAAGGPDDPLPIDPFDALLAAAAILELTTSHDSDPHSDPRATWQDGPGEHPVADAALQHDPFDTLLAEAGILEPATRHDSDQQATAQDRPDEHPDADAALPHDPFDALLAEAGILEPATRHDGDQATAQGGLEEYPVADEALPRGEFDDFPRDAAADSETQQAQSAAQDRERQMEERDREDLSLGATLEAHRELGNVSEIVVDESTPAAIDLAPAEAAQELLCRSEEMFGPLDDDDSARLISEAAVPIRAAEALTPSAPDIGVYEPQGLLKGITISDFEINPMIGPVQPAPNLNPAYDPLQSGVSYGPDGSRSAGTGPRGYGGEQSMGFYWGERDYFLVEGPSGASGHAANAPGFDGVAYNPATGHLVIYDNKAFAQSGNVYSATAINENFAKNLDKLIGRVQTMSDIPHQPQILDKLTTARAALTTPTAWPENVQVAVSNAGGQSAGTGGTLAGDRISFINYYAAPPTKPAPAPPGASTNASTRTRVG